MSKRNKQHPERQVPSGSAEAEEVRRLIEKNNSKSALDLAKQLHKRVNDAGSEALLADAYLARVRSMREHRMDAEADALIAVMRERCPSAKDKLDSSSDAVPARVSLDELVRPLADPALLIEQRTAIEDVLKKRLDDLPGLARCSTLPSDHPLRTGAAVLDQAFRAVTSGPVTEEAVALQEISRRSPLASWKMLARAIAAFYRDDDAACERSLQAIEPASVPARAVPVLRSLLSGQNGPEGKPAARALALEVSGGVEELRAALDSLDAAFAAHKKSRIYTEISRAVQACRQSAPDLLERLKQRIWVRTMEEGLEDNRVQGALGGPALKNAYLWLLFARSLEEPDGPIGLASSIWEAFRAHAVEEGWFPADGPEISALYLHMADLIRHFRQEELEAIRKEFRANFRGLDGFYLDQPRSIAAIVKRQDHSDLYYLDPEQLYQRACAVDPRAETFLQWMQWGQTDRHWKAANKAAEAWHRALPSDTRPLLYLAESAEERGALQKAIGFIERAERLDLLNPEVRRARFRLLVRGAMRHLTQRKPRLAERELAELENLPQAQEGDRPAVVAALRWVSCRLTSDEQRSAAQLDRASSLLGSKGTATRLFASLGAFCNLPFQESGLSGKLPIGPKDLLAAIVVRVGAIHDDIGMSFSISDEWDAHLMGEVAQYGGKLDIAQLRELGKAAVTWGRNPLAYAVSSAGLARGEEEARFLLLRAQALPRWETVRRHDCSMAAGELARRHRDMALVDEIVEFDKETSGFFELSAPGKGSSKEIEAVLKREKAAVSFPQTSPGRSPWHDEEDDEEEDDIDDEGPGFDPLMEEFARAVEALMRKQKGAPPAKKRKQRSGKQAELF